MREAGLEPAHPLRTLEPESSESANSTTRAYTSPDAFDSFDILTSEHTNVNTKESCITGNLPKFITCLVGLVARVSMLCAEERAGQTAGEPIGG